MKMTYLKAFLLIAIATASLSASASVSAEATSPQLHQFKFRMKGEVYEFSQKSGSYEEAFERAAKACYQHFKAGQRLSEDQGLDIIDVCANPRRS